MTKQVRQLKGSARGLSKQLTPMGHDNPERSFYAEQQRLTIRDLHPARAYPGRLALELGPALRPVVLLPKRMSFRDRAGRLEDWTGAPGAAHHAVTLALRAWFTFGAGSVFGFESRAAVRAALNFAFHCARC